jgi:parallel beta-helix repeat protein
MSFRRHSLFALLALAAPLHAETLKVPQQFGSIQDAIDAADADDVVQVSKGVYRENVTIIDNDIKLQGKPGAVIDGGYVGDCVSVSGNDFEISGFTLVSGGIGQLLVSDGPPNVGGLQVQGTNAKVSKLEVRACEGFGIKIRTGSVENCTVDGIAGIGIFVDTLDSQGDLVSEVSKCKVYRSAIGILALEGPFAIEKNVVEQCVSMGIYAVIETILLEGGPQLVLPSRVAQNTVSHTMQFGMQLAIGTGETTVEKNTLRDNGYGMYLQGFGHQVLSNTIEDNNLHGLIVFASGTNVAKNKVRNNGSVGILVGAGEIISDGANDGGNDIVDCLVQDNAGDGIHVLSNVNEITDCTLKGNLGDGLQVALNATGNEVTELSVSDNGHDGVDNSGTSTVISGVTSKGNGGADLAGKGNGSGTTAGGSGDNVVGDGSGLASNQELDMEIGDS